MPGVLLYCVLWMAADAGNDFGHGFIYGFDWAAGVPSGDSGMVDGGDIHGFEGLRTPDYGYEWCVLDESRWESGAGNATVLI
jgi:hypothetical protein